MPEQPTIPDDGAERPDGAEPPEGAGYAEGAQLADGAEPPRNDSTGRPRWGQGNEMSAFLAIGMAFFIIGMSQGLGEGGTAFFAIGVAFVAIGLSGARRGDADPRGPGDVPPPEPTVPRDPPAPGEESPSAP